MADEETPPTLTVVPDPQEPWGVTLADMTATGATYRRLDYWVRSGILSPDASAPGSGYNRRWTERDLTMAYYLVALTHAGITLKLAAEMAARLIDHDEVVVYVDTPAGKMAVAWTLADTPREDPDDYRY